MIRVTVLVIVVFTTTKNRRISKTDRAAIKANFHNLLISILLFVCYSTYFVLRVYVEKRERRTQQHHTCC